MSRRKGLSILCGRRRRTDVQRGIRWMEGFLVKYCLRCGDWRLTSAFYRDRAKYDGLSSACKECQAASHRA